MRDYSQEHVNDNQIESLIQDFLQIDIEFNAMLPKEIEYLNHLIDEIRITNKPQRFINCNLFSRIIYNLYREDSMTMGELSHTLSVPFSTTTRMVDWFVDNSYAQRLSDPEDRRVVRVALTDSGRELNRTVERYMVQRFRRMLSPLTAEEQSVLLMLLEKMARALRDTEIKV
ncbi:MAG: MarR family transcriptional regulator [Dehalococcoidia bacterium]|nr:MarR family transcriptional regulator [Dehalococcoidia bacterium]